MSYDNLKQLVKPVAQELVLNASDFPDSAVGRLLTVFFDDGALQLTNAVATPDDNAEEIALEGLLGNAFLGITNLAGQLELSATFSTLGEDERAVLRLRFRNDWTLTESLREGAFTQLADSLDHAVRSQLDFAITSFTLDSETYSLTIGISPDLELDLAGVSRYIQGLSIASQFPAEGFPSFATGLALKSFDIETRIDPMVPASLSVELGLAGNATWEPLGDLVVFTDLSADVLVTNPLDSPAATVDVAAEAVVTGTAIAARVSLPSRDFECFLRQGEKIDIVSLLESIADVPLPLPEVICTGFAITGQPRSSTYDFYAVLETDWEILPNLVLTGVSAELSLITRPERSVSGGFAGEIQFGQAQFFVTADNEPGATGWQFNGGVESGTTVKVGEFIDTLVSSFELSSNAVIDQVKDILGDITITELETSFHTQTKDFAFSCAMDFALDDKLSTLILNIGVDNTTEGHSIRFSGVLFVGIRQFLLDFTRSREGEVTTTSLLATYRNPEGEEIDIVSGVIDVVSSTTPLVLPDNASDLDLTTLTLYELRLSYDKTVRRTQRETQYGLYGDFAWKPSLNLDGDSIAPFEVAALVDLSKSDRKNSAVVGAIEGQVDSTIEGFDFLTLGARYELKDPSSGNRLQVLLTIGEVTFVAEHAGKDGNVKLAFAVDLAGALTLGDVVTFIVSLIDPSIDDFEFDPPWNFITDFDIGSLLENLSLKIEMIRARNGARTKKVTVDLDVSDLTSFVPSELRSVLNVSAVGLSFISTGKRGGKYTKSTQISLTGSLVGNSQALSWDPLGPPPEIPGQGASVFELRYMGLGQHVAFTQAGQVESMKEVMDLLRDAINERESAVRNDYALQLRNPLETFGDGGVIAFSPESEWLIGLDVTLLKTLSLTVIFNDPVIYGLRIELYGKQAKNFAGLQFEIVYTRITDTIGKYHIDLALPDYVRYYQAGAVSITLPLLVLDIFTNGDFKVDLGFPWNFRFARSFALEMFPFTGAGGFYFNKLSAATASSIPKIRDDYGVFTPVYEFGLGLKIGLGKSFRSGPLKAEISITVQGLVEGVISWYNPVQEIATQRREVYYRIAGGIAIVGRIYGEVDFGIISASLEVLARAMVQFALESYKPIPILLTAEVSVRASVKVAFVRIRFSFGMRVQQKFVIDSPNGTNAPWRPGLIE